MLMRAAGRARAGSTEARRDARDRAGSARVLHRQLDDLEGVRSARASSHTRPSRPRRIRSLAHLAMGHVEPQHRRSGDRGRPLSRRDRVRAALRRCSRAARPHAARSRLPRSGDGAARGGDRDQPERAHGALGVRPRARPRGALGRPRSAGRRAASRTASIAPVARARYAWWRRDIPALDALREPALLDAADVRARA